jgi:hypothetical protein
MGRLVGLVVLGALVAVPVEAGLDIDFGASVRLGDDADLYLAISSRYFERDRVVVDKYAVRYADPDDLAVALFISQRSGQSPEYIFSLYRQGHTWWEISLRVGLPTDTWFIDVEREPGPPYGKAYGYWKKQKRDKHYRMALTDDDIRHLMAVRMIHEYWGVPVELAMEWRSSGQNLRSIMSGEYEKRHGKSSSHSKSDSNGGNKGDQGKGHAKKH